MALRRGASMFVRHEWMVRVGNRLYISESGNDLFDLARPLALGGKLPKHLEAKRTKGTEFSDSYGRILVLDLTTNHISVVVEGGIIGNDPQQVFANPDALTAVHLNNKDYLVISEDLIWRKEGLVGNGPDGGVYNEVYFLDLSVAQPQRTDLQRFMVGPKGCETTGNTFTPDGSTYFIAIQHPDTTNTIPFNRSGVMANDMAPALK